MFLKWKGDVKFLETLSVTSCLTGNLGKVEERQICALRFTYLFSMPDPSVIRALHSHLSSKICNAYAVKCKCHG